MKNKEKLCCIFNYAPHYRLPVYSEMSKKINCDFYFGDKLKFELKKINYDLLKPSSSKELKTFFFKKFSWRKGLVSLAFKKEYNHFIVTWEPLNLSLWIFLISCFILNKKVYSWQHGIQRKSISKKYLILEKLGANLQKGIFLYGDFARQNMIKLGFSKDKLHLIYNSLDYNQSKKYREVKFNTSIYKDYFNSDLPVLLFIGRLTKVKKIHYILEAQKRLKKEKRGEFNLIIIGDGVERDNINEFINKNNLNNSVWMHGELYDEKSIAEFLSLADLCVSPGNVGLTAMHALSYGLPVITNNNFETQMPEFEAIEEGITGSFFEEDNIESLTKVVSLWLKSNSTKEKREQIKKECYKVIDLKYNPIKQVEILKEIII
jgi:glycosyltransferase involved in cell wall biosynthesis